MALHNKTYTKTQFQYYGRANKIYSSPFPHIYSADSEVPQINQLLYMSATISMKS